MLLRLWPQLSLSRLQRLRQEDLIPMDCGGTAKLRCSGTLICQNFLRRPFHKKPGSTRANTGTPSSHRTTQCFGLMRFECHVSTLLCKGMKTALEIRSIPAVLFARSAAQAVEVLLRQRAYVVKRVGNGEGMANGSTGQVSWKKHGATGGWMIAKVKANWKIY